MYLVCELAIETNELVLFDLEDSDIELNVRWCMHRLMWEWTAC